MDRNEQMRQLIQEYQRIQAPQDGYERIQESIERGKKEAKRRRRARYIRNWCVGSAAALLFLVILLSYMNLQVADTKGSTRIVAESEGRTDTISLRENSVDENHTAQQVLSRFEKDMEESGEEYQELDVSYEILTDTENWFSLVVYAVETQENGNEFRRYYNIDKSTGEYVQLEDLFRDNIDYITVISDEIKRQMKTVMEADPDVIYWMDPEEYGEGFENIKKDQSFYRNADGNLVIVFDEYEILSGSYEYPEFVISEEAISK